MKLAARVALAIVVLLSGLFFLPRPASRVVAPDAFGQVPTELPTLIETASPSPTKTKPDPTKPPPTPDPKPTGGGDNNGGPGGGDNNGGPGGNNNGGPGGNNRGPGGNNKGPGSGGNGKKDKGADAASRAPVGKGAPFNATGEFTTDKLQIIATRLRAEGVDEDKIVKLVYTPFIIGGPAAWTNTWGAPRYGPGPIVRTHEGQDVFCRYGDPVLASENGTIEFDDGGLGGKVARLHRPDGSYWYYAHLSGWNTRDFKNGDAVKTGDVIGYCGNTGNAITTPPHVHFGWYQANGSTKDPMGALVGWLRAAEQRAGKAYKKITGESIEAIPEQRSSRLFGDSFAPDISVLKVSSEALLAATSAPGSSAFGLAEAALQAALANAGNSSYDPSNISLETTGAGISESKLAELLRETSSSTSPEPGGSD